MIPAYFTRGQVTADRNSRGWARRLLDSTICLVRRHRTVEDRPKVAMEKDDRPKRSEVDEISSLLFMGIEGDYEAFRMAMSSYENLADVEKIDIWFRMQDRLGWYIEKPFENLGKTVAIRNFAKFFEEASIDLASNGIYDGLGIRYRYVVNALCGILDEPLRDDEKADGYVMPARLACTHTLWGLGFSDVEFWERKLFDKGMQFLVIQMFLYRGTKESDYLKCLTKHLKVLGKVIARYDFPKKMDFFGGILKDGDAEQITIVLKALRYANQLPEDVLQLIKAKLEDSRIEIAEEAFRLLITEHRFGDIKDKIAHILTNGSDEIKLFVLSEILMRDLIKDMIDDDAALKEAIERVVRETNGTKMMIKLVEGSVRFI